MEIEGVRRDAEEEILCLPPFAGAPARPLTPPALSIITLVVWTPAAAASLAPGSPLPTPLLASPRPRLALLASLVPLPLAVVRPWPPRVLQEATLAPLAAGCLTARGTLEERLLASRRPGTRPAHTGLRAGASDGDGMGAG